MSQAINAFARYDAPDPVEHARQIEQMRAALQTAEPGTLRQLDHAVDLASLLTTARQEAEALALLEPLQPLALVHLACEPAGWYYLAHGTASQYLNRRDKANAMFGEALRLSQAQGWERLEHFVHVHWGRSRVEERLFSEARAHFQRALSQRERLQHPGAGRVRELLSALDAIEGGHVQDLLPSDAKRPFG
jgi:tetratricopeptide (TPR) repeat protein